METLPALLKHFAAQPEFKAIIHSLIEMSNTSSRIRRAELELKRQQLELWETIPKFLLNSCLQYAQPEQKTSPPNTPSTQPSATPAQPSATPGEALEILESVLRDFFGESRTA